MRIYVVTILVSVIAHWALVGGLSRAAREAPKKQRVIEMAVLAPPPPPPTVIDTPPVPEPKQDLTKRPPPPRDPKVTPPPPQDTPPPSNTQESPSEEPAKPVFGISMSSTVSGNSGFQVRVGNTTMKEPEKERTKPEDVRPYAGGSPIVPVYSLAQPPKRMGDCREAYPAAAKAAGVKGSIKLELVILEDGTVGDVKPLNDLGYGTLESAVRVMKKCRFSPGNDGTKAVRTQITYSYTFNYEDE